MRNLQFGRLYQLCIELKNNPQLSEQDGINQLTQHIQQHLQPILQSLHMDTNTFVGNVTQLYHRLYTNDLEYRFCCVCFGNWHLYHLESGNQDICENCVRHMSNNSSTFRNPITRVVTRINTLPFIRYTWTPSRMTSNRHIFQDSTQPTRTLLGQMIHLLQSTTNTNNLSLRQDPRILPQQGSGRGGRGRGRGVGRGGVVGGGGRGVGGRGRGVGGGGGRGRGVGGRGRGGGGGGRGRGRGSGRGGGRGRGRGVVPTVHATVVVPVVPIVNVPPTGNRLHPFRKIFYNDRELTRNIRLYEYDYTLNNWCGIQLRANQQPIVHMDVHPPNLYRSKRNVLQTRSGQSIFNLFECSVQMDANNRLYIYTFQTTLKNAIESLATHYDNYCTKAEIRNITPLHTLEASISIITNPNQLAIISTRSVDRFQTNERFNYFRTRNRIVGNRLPSFPTPGGNDIITAQTPFEVYYLHHNNQLFNIRQEKPPNYYVPDNDSFNILANPNNQPFILNIFYIRLTFNPGYVQYIRCFKIVPTLEICLTEILQTFHADRNDIRRIDVRGYRSHGYVRHCIYGTELP